MHVDICKSNCIVKKKIEIEKKQPLALKKKNCNAANKK